MRISVRLPLLTARMSPAASRRVESAPAQARYAAGVRDRSGQGLQEWRTTLDRALINICHAHRDIPLDTMLLLGVAGVEKETGHSVCGQPSGKA